MAVCFTYGVHAIMTGAAVIHDANMIKGCWSKASGLVAVTAITGGWHMVRWRGFSSGRCTIVTCGAVISNARVIKPGTSKGRGVMAQRAILCGRDVARVLLGHRRRSIITMA